MQQERNKEELRYTSQSKTSTPSLSRLSMASGKEFDNKEANVILSRYFKRLKTRTLEEITVTMISWTKTRQQTRINSTQTVSHAHEVDVKTRMP